MDSAHLQMQEAKFEDTHTHKSGVQKKHGTHHEHSIRGEESISEHDLALYDDNDVITVLSQFRSVEVRSRIEIYPEVFVTFYPSGHILGATYVVLEIGGKNILFTGDLGRGNHPILIGPDAPPPLNMDAVVTESTYGATAHDTNISHFEDELNAALTRGGSILIPAFAVDRTEEILFELRRLFVNDLVKQVPVYVDSPMAETVLNFYRNAVNVGSIDIKREIAEEFSGTDPFQTGLLQELYTTDESKMLNDINDQCIIISASGMATGGRVTYHLEHMLPDPNNTVILVGYQGRGTRGLLLEQGAEKIRIRGAWVPVNAHIATAMNFSVHADQQELMGWLKQIKSPGQVFIVHGERDSQQAMKILIESDLHSHGVIPELKKVYSI
jgi:metallo-beta-lactamase family protein